MFYLVKFATMLKDSPNLGNRTITINNDPRVLPFGKWLRKTKVNELMQLVNVLKGEMSLIGPRPLTQEVFDLYDQDQASKIASVMPGLSGIGSIVFRNEEKLLSNKQDALEFYKSEISPKKAALELWFIRRRNLKTYFQLIFLTIIVVIAPRYIEKIVSSLGLPMDI